MLIFIQGSSAKSQSLQQFMRTFGQLSISCLWPLFRRSKPWACFGTERYSPKCACFHVKLNQMPVSVSLPKTACLELTKKHWQLGFKMFCRAYIYTVYIFSFPLDVNLKHKNVQFHLSGNGINLSWKLSLLWRCTCTKRIYCTDVTEINCVSLKCSKHLHELYSANFLNMKNSK